MGKLAARIFLEKTTIAFDKPFDYLIPYDLSDKVFIGQRVLVPFGRANKKRQGVVVETIYLDQAITEKLKPIAALIDKKPLVTDEMLKMANFISDQSFCTFFEALKPMIPIGINVNIVTSYSANKNLKDSDLEGLSFDERQVLSLLQNKSEVKQNVILDKLGFSNCDIINALFDKGLIVKHDNAVRRVGDASIRMVKLADDVSELIETVKLTVKQKAVFDFLEEIQAASVKEVCYFTGVTQAVITTLEKKGVVNYYSNEIYRSPYEQNYVGERNDITLNEEQTVAYKGLQSLSESNESNTALLYGVTGSGKTQVFLKLIDKVIDSDKGIIVMVPEIALTPQAMSIFQKRYGSQIAIFHSAMSLGQRTDEWKRIKRGQAKIAIGTRSAIFAPFDNIGLIIMDEEQEHTYKSESTPRFHARNLARFRAKYHNCLFLMASATPAVETFSLAKAGKYHMFTLKNRYGNISLPKVKTVDMKQQYKKGNFSIFSEELIESLTENLHNKKQSILLLNRRGYHVFISCRSCGNVKECPNCSISLTYHSANNRLMCHYCGYSEIFSETCTACSQKQMKLNGFGTQKVEEQLNLFFPDARVLRMDADTTMKRFSHEEKLTAFANGEYDIMIGTQMVAKGLDFPCVTLVGVINADQALYDSDYRSSEKAFSLLTQVIGRSGRSDEGTALIQTVTPESEIVSLSAKQNYDDFFKTEILARKHLVYPPYCDLIVIGFAGVGRDRVKSSAADFLIDLKEKIIDNEKIKLIVLGPSPCNVPKVNNKYRYRLIIKCRNNRTIRNLLRELLIKYISISKYKGVTVYSDINPESIL